MPISPADIAALKQRIKSDLDTLDEARNRLQAEYAAAEVLEKRVQNEKAESQLPLELGQPPAPAVPSGVSFAEAVRRAIDQFQDKTFTVRDVESMLKAMNVALPPNNLRPRISGEVKGEIVRKKLLLVEKGSGHVPHKYRRLVQAIQETERVLIRPRTHSVQQH